MRDFPKVVVCPRCSQGEVLLAKVAKTGMILLVCHECEATWTGSRVTAVGFEDLGTILERQGLPPLWSELEPAANNGA